MLATACAILSCHCRGDIGSGIWTVNIEIASSVEVIISRSALEGDNLCWHLVIAILNYVGVKVLTVECIAGNVGLETCLFCDIVVEGFDDARQRRARNLFVL